VPPDIQLFVRVHVVDDKEGRREGNRLGLVSSTIIISSTEGVTG